MNKDKDKKLQNEVDASATVTNAGDSVRRHRASDWVARLLCLAFAFFLWFYIMEVDSPEYEQVFTDIPIELTNTAKLENENGQYVYSGYGGTVDVTLRGRISDMNSVTADDIRVTADVGGITSAGIHPVELTAAVNGSVSVASLSSGSVNIYTDERATVTVGVAARIVSVIVESPNRLGDPVLETTEISVTGPRTVLDNIAYAQASLDLGRVTATQTMVTKLTLIGAGGETVPTTYLKLSRSEVAVTVPLYTDKTVALGVLFKNGFYNADNAEITITPATVELRGDPEALSGLASLSIATLDEKQITDDESRIIAITYPEGVESVAGIESATVEIKHKNTIKRRFVCEKIIANNPSGITYTLPETKLQVTLRGPAEAMRGFSSDDITATLDLSNYSGDSVGTVTEAVTINIANAPAGVYEVGAYSMQVILGNG